MALHLGLTSHGGVLEGLVLHLVEPYDSRRPRGICGESLGLAEGDDCTRGVPVENGRGDLVLGVEVAAGGGGFLEESVIVLLLFSVINVVSVSFPGDDVER